MDTWFVSFRHPFEIWENHRSFLLVEIVFFSLTLLTFIHAILNGGRYVYLWFGTLLHGFVVEGISYLLPDIDSFWHAQSMVMFIGKRLPLYIVFLYSVFLYTATVTVARLHLRKWAEPFAVALAVVLLDVPYDIMGIKLLFWSWHDTDPNIFDRHYWVPWTSYYFHAAFSSGFVILFHGTRSLLSKTEKFQSDGFLKETFCTLVSGLLGMPLGVLQFVPVYHVLHDNFNIHTEVCVLLFLAVYALLAWMSDRNPTAGARSSIFRAPFDELTLLVFVYYLFFISLVSFEKPERMKSIGLHEPIGDCDSVTLLHTPIGQVLPKKKYLCVNNYDEGYFDFHCVPPESRPNSSGITSPLHWYTICGTPYPNHIEYVVVVTAFCLFGLCVYLVMIFNSGQQPLAKTGARVERQEGGRKGKGERSDNPSKERGKKKTLKVN